MAVSFERQCKLFGIHERFVFLVVTPVSILTRPVLSKQRAPCFFIQIKHRASYNRFFLECCVNSTACNVLAIVSNWKSSGSL